VIGFTNGIAVLIGLSQVKDFLGLSIAKMPGDFFGSCVRCGPTCTLNPWAGGGGRVAGRRLGWQHAMPTLGPRAPFSGRSPGAGHHRGAGGGHRRWACSSCRWRPSAALRRHPAALPAFALPEFSWETVR
jgi:SulP family sulfate permease